MTPIVLRKLGGLKQDELARRVRISRTSLSRIECGAVSPSHKLVREHSKFIAQVLGIKEDEYLLSCLQAYYWRQRFLIRKMRDERNH